jgi:hypothetical protein
MRNGPSVGIWPGPNCSVFENEGSKYCYTEWLTKLGIALLIMGMAGCHVYDDFDWRQTREVRKVLITKLEECSCPIGQVACYRLFYPTDGVWTCEVCNPNPSASSDGHESSH